jgi:hypothetical protein
VMELETCQMITMMEDMTHDHQTFTPHARCPTLSSTQTPPTNPPIGLTISQSAVELLSVSSTHLSCSDPRAASLWRHQARTAVNNPSTSGAPTPESLVGTAAQQVELCGVHRQHASYGSLTLHVKFKRSEPPLPSGRSPPPPPWPTPPPGVRTSPLPRVYGTSPP